MRELILTQWSRSASLGKNPMAGGSVRVQLSELRRLKAFEWKFGSLSTEVYVQASTASRNHFATPYDYMPMMDGCSTVVIAPPCDRSWRDGEVIFLDKAISQLGGQKQLGNGIIALADYEFHFAPVEVFRGVSSGAKEVVVYTGHGMGDCSEPFVVGASYLVYARSVNGLLKAWTGTMQEAMAGGA